jgi:hypothetical protein
VLNEARAATLISIAIVASCCGGTRATPTAPGSPTTSSMPVLRGVTVNRTNIEAGDEIIATATIDGSWTPATIRYVWAVQPNAGVLTSNGSTLRWRAPSGDPVPATYVFSVTLAEASDTTAFGGPGAASSAAPAVSSPPVTVNDARRETISQTEAFLTDLADSSVSPQLCVRNFTDSCEGKQRAIEDASALRATYSSASIAYDLQLFVRSVEWANCVAPDGSARCALLIYNADWTRTRRTDSVQERVSGTEYVQAYYERNRWWLCSRRFEAK